MKASFAPKERWSLVLSLAVLAMCVRSHADTLVLKSGRRIEGKILQQSDESVTIRVPPGGELRLPKSNIAEIIVAPGPAAKSVPPTNATPAKAAAPAPSPPTVRPPVAAPAAPPAKVSPPVAVVRTPLPAKSSSPPATLITQPNFQPRGNWGGLSDGKLLGVDGKPLADHKLYAIDTYYFLRKVRDGFRRQGRPADERRLSDLGALVTAEAFVRNLTEDLAAGHYLSKSKEKTEKAIEDKRRELAGDAPRYEQRHGTKHGAAPEYALLTLLAHLDGALRSYDIGEGTLNYEEKLRVADRIRLDDQPSPRGTGLRTRMKTAIHHMAELRAQILAAHRETYAAGRLEEEKSAAALAATAAAVHTVSRDGALLFPYQQVEGSAAMDGLREHALGQPISRAKPVVLNRGDRVEVVRTHTVVYPAAAGRSETKLEVVQVRLRTEGLTDLKSGKKLPLMSLEGWMLPDRIQKGAP